MRQLKKHGELRKLKMIKKKKKDREKLNQLVMNKRELEESVLNTKKLSK